MQKRSFAQWLHRPVAFWVLALGALTLGPPQAWCQTPSPLQEWQYSGGIILAKLFEPDLPKWRRVVGVASEVQPVYDGSHAYRVSGGPVINIQYRDRAFISTGDGIGFNFLHGKHYQVGFALAYDLGRKEKDDLANLQGMGDISAAPVAKLYGAWVNSKARGTANDPTNERPGPSGPARCASRGRRSRPSS